MRTMVISAVAALGLLTSACATDPYGGGGYGGGTQLSACTRNALIGAGVGALGGVIASGENNRGENAALGAAIGAAGAYAACRFLGIGDEQRVYGAYNNALATGQPQQLSWAGQSGGQRNLTVAAPQPVPGQPNCRTVRANLSAGSQGSGPLPVERYCQNAQGVWVPG